MAILKIARMGNPVLKQIALPVADPTDSEIARLAADMKDTLLDIHSNGLAAPQVHVAKRVVVYRVPAERIPAGSTMEPVPWTTMINPVIEPLSPTKKDIWERCLSIPGMHGLVPRYQHIRITFLTLKGKTVRREARGFHASLLQHECDHLDGTLYPMRMTDLSKLAFDSEIGNTEFFVRRAPEEFD
ncbi:MAG: peptide deformylase [Alphaproteobacteria bacterium]|nr:peptide deformylase [Alphaproteobacteria bacterium]